MNEMTQKEERDERKKENQSEVFQTATINEKIAGDDPNQENGSNVQPATDGDILIFEDDEKYEDGQNTDLETLLAAWWKYKRANKLKRKKKKILRIYRDENYWTHDRYTDDEDFIHSET